MSLPSTPQGFRPDELLAIVNETDEEIGAERRDLIHARGLLHRAVHVLVHSPDGRLLIQQRSRFKDTFPLHWECVGGHLGPSERYLDAAVREVQEELGISGRDFRFLGKLAACEMTGMEFIEVYEAVAPEELCPDPSEVIAVEWITRQALLEEMKTGARLFSPTFLHTLRSVNYLIP